MACTVRVCVCVCVHSFHMYDDDDDSHDVGDDDWLIAGSLQMQCRAHYVCV